MSFRTALRLASRASAQVSPAARVQVQRRAASSSAPKGSSGNATWAMGSALFFGGLSAFILAPSSKKDHVAHQNHPHEPKEPGEVQFTSQEKRDAVKSGPIEDAQKGEGGEGVEESAEEKESVKKGLETDAPPVAAGSSTEGDSGTSSKAEVSTPDNVDDSGAPSDQEITAASVRAERTDAPLVAESEEVKGTDVQAKKD